jgi:PAS domain S-box-containing protein
VNSIILVAENDASIRKLIKDILCAKGYQVETTGSFAVAASFMERQEPDLVFASFALDGGRGCDLLREAKSHGYDVPLILITDVSVENPADEVARFDALTHLNKPIDRSRLEMLARLGLVTKGRMVREMHRVRELSLLRSFMSALLDTGDEAVFLLDGGGVVVEVNRSGGGLLQVAPEAIPGQQYLSLLPSMSAGLQRDAIAKARSTNLSVHIEEHRGGAVYFTTVHPALEQDDLAGFVVVTRDITAQHRSEMGLAESEKRYRSVYEAARDAIILFDRNDGSILDCNGAARRLYGYTSDEMLHLSIRDISDDPERSLEIIQSGVERSPLRHHRRKDGTIFSVEVSMSHFVHDGREVCTSYVQDISHRKVVEEALREGARLYRAVVEDQTELICRYEPNGNVTFANGAYANFFDVDEEEIVGKSLFPFSSLDDLEPLKAWLKKAGSANPVFEYEQRQTRSDGVLRWIQWTNRAIVNHANTVVEIQAIGRDITERKDAEQALGKATMEKEQYRLNLEATFRSIPDAIVSVDSELRVIATNSAAGILFGMDRDRARGRDLEEQVHAQGNPCVGVLKQVLRTSKSVRGYEIELNVPALGERMVEINCSPLIDQNKRHAGAVLVVRDVSRIADLEKRLQERHGFRGIVGRSGVMQDVYHFLEQLSSLDSIVLILGESGTGKELVADALHYGGSRAGHPFIKVNCSALSEGLLESELFGHVRGAFTGAVRDKVGRIQAAQGGTLFLDEIGDISPLIQLKLLRFLEQKEYERVGESKTCSADVRIIAATNAKLQNLVRQGSFREDLYYRLNVMPVSLPPLRERQADIPLLVEHFLDVFSGQFNKSYGRASDELMDLFMSYRWPGNIRELRHILEYACILSPGGEIAIKHIRKDLVDQMRASGFRETESPVSLVPRFPVSRKVDKEDVLAALERCGGNKARAARQLGIHRATLYRKLEAWNLG